MRQKPAAMKEMQEKMIQKKAVAERKKKLIAETKRGLEKVIKKYGKPKKFPQRVEIMVKGVPIEFAVRNVKMKDGTVVKKWVRVFSRKIKSKACKDGKEKNAKGRCVLKREPKKPKECGKGTILKRGRCVKIKKELSDKQKKAIATRKRRLNQLISKAGSAKNSRVGHTWSGMLDGKMQKFEVKLIKIGNKEIKKWVKVKEYCPPGSSRGKSGRCVKDKKVGCKSGKVKNDKGRCVTPKFEGPCPKGTYRTTTGCKKRTYTKKAVDRSVPCKPGEYRRKSGHCAKRPTRTGKSAKSKGKKSEPTFGIIDVPKLPKNNVSFSTKENNPFSTQSSQNFLKNTSQTLNQSVMKYNI